MDRFIVSSKTNPCPVCDRTKDGDCKSKEAGNLVLCHSHTSDAGQINHYKFLRPSKDGLWGVWVYQEEHQGKIKGRKLPSIVGRQSYIYTDRVGRNLVRATRIPREGGKTFAQSRWDGADWVNGLNEYAKINVPIYRYLDVRAAIDRGETVFMVEGEGKADALWDLGVAATTTLGGSKKYRSYGKYFEDLKDADLVLCPDRDKVGIEHMEDIHRDFPRAQWCYVFPQSPLWKHLPDNGGLDIADWIRDGATAEEIRAAIAPKRPPAQPTEVAQVQEDEKVPRLLKEFYLTRDLLGNRLRFNELTKEIELDGKPLNIDRIKLDLAIQHNISLKSSREDVQDIISAIAEENKFSPVVDYLEACHQKHGDDTSILDDLAARYFGQSAPIYNAMVKRTLIAAVARAIEPGCKVDTALILQGKQGSFKSSFFKTLAGRWFDDSLSNASDKDERLKLHRAWFVEWSELETIFKRKDVSAAKAFLSCSTDFLRPPYGRTVQELPRHSVIVGTTNLDEFLSDTTGNRRFWVIPVVQQINLAQLQQERDRIWAAAVALYKAGEQWYLQPQEEESASAIAEQFQSCDPWREMIADHIKGLERVTTRDILENLLKIEPGRLERAQQMRVADILRELGFQGRFDWIDGKRCRVWVAPSDRPPDQPDQPREEGRAVQNVDIPPSAQPDRPDRPQKELTGKILSPASPSENLDLFTKTGRSGRSGYSNLEGKGIPPDQPQNGGRSGRSLETNHSEEVIWQI